MKLHLTPERLVEIKERCAKATPGPWGLRLHDGTMGVPDDFRVLEEEGVDYSILGLIDNRAAAFIAASRTDIPNLVHDWRVLSQRVAFLEARNAELENAIRIVHERYGETYTRNTSGNCCPNAMRELHEVLNKK